MAEAKKDGNRNSTMLAVTNDASQTPCLVLADATTKRVLVDAAQADGGNQTLGAKANARSTATDTTEATVMSVLKQISYMEQNPASRAVTNAGTFAVQVGSALTGVSNPTIDSYSNAAISAAANTANQVLISSAANKQIWVYGINFTLDTGAGTVSFQDEDDTAISGVMAFAANGEMAISPSGNFSMPVWKLATDKDLEVDTVTCGIKGSIQYAIVSV